MGKWNFDYKNNRKNLNWFKSLSVEDKLFELNNILWVLMDLIEFLNKEKKEVNEFYKKVMYENRWMEFVKLNNVVDLVMFIEFKKDKIYSEEELIEKEIKWNKLLKKEKESEEYKELIKKLKEIKFYLD